MPWAFLQGQVRRVGPAGAEAEAPSGRGGVKGKEWKGKRRDRESSAPWNGHSPHFQAHLLPGPGPGQLPLPPESRRLKKKN